MSANLTIRQAQMVLPDRVATGDLVIEDGIIVEIAPHCENPKGEVIDATGLTLLPGLIDSLVQFGGLEDAESIDSGTRAAAAGGVTSVINVPRLDAASDIPSIKEQAAQANEHSRVHYGFYFLASPENIVQVGPEDGACGALVHPRCAGVLEQGESALEAIFTQARVPLYFVAEDPIRLHERRLLYPDTHDVCDHSKIYDPRTASDATATAVALALAHGVSVHFLEVSSEEETQVLARHPSNSLTASASLFHLLMANEETCESLGGFAHTVPPLRSVRHQHALWAGVQSGQIQCLTSGHRSVSIAEKSAPYPDSAPGLPGVEWSLPLCLDQVSNGRMTLHDITRLWCEGPANIHKLPRKGRLEVGYDGDVVLVNLADTHKVSAQTTFSRCGWSPWDGQTLTGKPVFTAVSGRPVFREGEVLSIPAGKALNYAN